MIVELFVLFTAEVESRSLQHSAAGLYMGTEKVLSNVTKCEAKNTASYFLSNKTIYNSTL